MGKPRLSKNIIKRFKKDDFFYVELVLEFMSKGRPRNTRSISINKVLYKSQKELSFLALGVIKADYMRVLVLSQGL